MRQHPLRILILEPEPRIASVLAAVLEADGDRVDTAGDKAAALGRITDHAYDLILADMEMPGLDAPELQDMLDQVRPLEQPRVAFLTARAHDPSTRALLERPFSLRQVREQVQLVLTTS
ncbi:MAG TPA: response regulator [Candidatus Limnocylindrales bacterium]|nr:response regulator [Candidatus Limnocylindrales bacterium]